MKNPSMLIVPRAPRRPLRLAALCAALVAALCAGALVASCSNFNDFQDALGTRVYTVTFDSGAATTPASPASMTVTSPATTLAALPTDPARTGYDFGGWYSEPDGEGTAFTSATTVSANCTVHAKWTPISYSITWHLNEGTLSTPNPANYTIESPAIVFGEPTRDAYYFAGWYDNESCSGDAVTQLAAGSTGAKEYWAKWSLIPVYTVAFDSGAATTPASPASMTVTSPATTLAALPTEPVRNNYYFGGWYTEPNGAGTAFTTASTVSANCTVHAKWTAISYSITWHLNEGTLSTPNPENYTIESPAIVFGEPTRDAYYFAGWYDNESCSGDAVTQLAAGSTGAKEYWAKWSLIPVYTVTFDSGAATTPASPASMTVTSPATTLSALPTDPARTGYDFGGWYSEPNGAGTAFTSATTVNANCTVHAKWTPISYSITWHLNEGTLVSPNPVNYTIESPAIVFGAPIRDAYYFAGWYDNENCTGDAVSELATGSTGAKEYWAKWTPLRTITFNANGGMGSMDPQVLDQGQTAALTANSYTRSDHSFAGWAVNTNACVVYADTANYTMPSSNVTLYAIWQYTGTSLATLSSESTASVSMADVASTDTDGYLLAHDGSPYVQATSTSGGFAHRITPFTMAQYEVTYELWYTVRTWAQANGYSFGNLGREGSQGTNGAVPTAAGRLRPVTTVSWRDAMVWCNAYSEMAGRVPYYYSDAAFTSLLKTATNLTTVTASTAGSQDAPFINPNGTGYRLSTEGEWQYAASCGGIYPYNYASGADAVYGATSGGSDIDGDGVERYSGDVAWYYDNSNSLGSSHPDYGTHPAGTKAPNALGLYDMSGNVYEWCFDWYGSNPSSAQEDYSGPARGSYRLLRGGSWYGLARYLQVGFRFYDNPCFAYFSIGFRLVEDF